jgi:hypothetical protein
VPLEHITQSGSTYVAYDDFNDESKLTKIEFPKLSNYGF